MSFLSLNTKSQVGKKASACSEITLVRIKGVTQWIICKVKTFKTSSEECPAVNVSVHLTYLAPSARWGYHSYELSCRSARENRYCARRRFKPLTRLL